MAKDSGYAASYNSAGTVDCIISFIQTNWTKIGNMQQSASILLAILSLIITISVTSIFSSTIKEYEQNEKIIVFSILVISLIFLAVAFFYLYNIIAPKKIKNQIKDFEALYKAVLKKLASLDHKIEYDAETGTNLIYLNILNKMNKRLNKLIKRNQCSYSKCISYAIISLISNLFFIAFLVIKYIASKISCLFSFAYFELFCFIILIFVIKMLICNKIKEV